VEIKTCGKHPLGEFEEKPRETQSQKSENIKKLALGDLKRGVQKGSPKKTDKGTKGGGEEADKPTQRKTALIAKQVWIEVAGGKKKIDKEGQSANNSRNRPKGNVGQMVEG